MHPTLIWDNIIWSDISVLEFRENMVAYLFYLKKKQQQKNKA